MYSVKSQNNDTHSYVSELFRLTTSLPVQLNLDTRTHENIYACCDSFFFIVNRKGFEYQTTSTSAKIDRMNAFTGEVEIFNISLPPTCSIPAKYIWIWALAAFKSLLFIAIDEAIWVYQFADSKQYKFIKTIALKDVSQLAVMNNELHAFIENNIGFDWFKINLVNFEITHVRALTLINPFFLQIDPVKVICMSNHALYLLQQNEPAIEKYSLTGELMVTYSIEIPNWKNIPENITNKLDSIEDTTERNYAMAKFSIFDYNSIHLFYTFSNERFLMIAIDKNSTRGTYITPYYIQIIGENTIVEPYSVKLDEDRKFGERYFPFLTRSLNGNIIFDQLNEYVTQINLSSNVSWQNKTHKAYLNDVNLFHRDNDPIEKIETYRFIKNYIPADSIQFLDYDDHIFSLNNVPAEKAIFIISQYPQCSACIKALWNYFTCTPLPNVELYNVSQDCNTYLLKKENMKEVSTFLKAKFTPLFIDKKNQNEITQRLLDQRANPLVILFNKRLQHIEVISSMNIVGDIMGNLTPSFVERIKNFVDN
jgi:hypothetical protein